MLLLGCCECFTPQVDRSTTARPQRRSFRYAAPTPLYQTTKAGAADDMSSSCDVAIFGGGFGGLYTALELSQRDPQLQIALIEPNDQFVFLPLLYDLSMGYATEAEVCPLYKDILVGTNIRHVKASLHSMTHYQQACCLQRSESTSTIELNFKAAVISVGASPQSLLETVPGADDFCQPFYTAKDARRTKRLIEQLERQYDGTTLQMTVVGGGYGGVELVSCLARKFGSKASITLINRSDAPPMAGTRAESVVTKALQELNIQVQSGTSVKKIERIEEQSRKYREQYRMFFSSSGDNDSDDAVFDAIFWTAGSAPAPPVSSDMDNNEQEDPLPLLQRTQTGRLCVDENLQCQWKVNDENDSSNIFACGDCAEIPNMTPAVPKTAQAAMQQSSVVAHNVVASLKSKPLQKFQFQDLGSMLTLGGASGAIMAPQDGSLSSLLESALSVTSTVLQEADSILTNTNNPVAKQLGLKPENLQKLGLTLGGYATSNNKGTLSGAVSGAARRAVYAARMPTNSQRGIALASSVLSTAVRVAQDVTEELNAPASNKGDNDGDGTLSTTKIANDDP